MELNGISQTAGHNYPAPEQRAEAQSTRTIVREDAPANSLEEQVSARQRAATREKLVLRPSEVSLNDRLEQVISLDMIKQLLNLRSAGPAKAARAPGMLFDLRA